MEAITPLGFSSIVRSVFETKTKFLQRDSTVVCPKVLYSLNLQYTCYISDLEWKTEFVKKGD